METVMPVEKLKKQAFDISSNYTEYQKLLDFIGYLRVGNLVLPKLLILKGDGNNGKTMFIDLVIEYLQSLNLRSVKLNSALLNSYRDIPVNYSSINLIILTEDINVEDIDIKDGLIPHKLHIYGTNQDIIKIPADLTQCIEIVECNQTFN